MARNPWQVTLPPLTWRCYAIDAILIPNRACLNFNSDVNISIEHIAIPSSDPVALKNWYERVLGAREVFNNGQQPPTFLIGLPGGGWFEIYAADGVPENRRNNKLAGFRHIALRVDSLDATRTELEKRGVRFTEPERAAAGGGKVQFFEDCEGNLLHLVERPAGGIIG